MSHTCDNGVQSGEISQHLFPERVNQLCIMLRTGTHIIQPQSKTCDRWTYLTKNVNTRDTAYYNISLSIWKSSNYAVPIGGFVFWCEEMLILKIWHTTYANIVKKTHFFKVKTIYCHRHLKFCVAKGHLGSIGCA